MLPDGSPYPRLTVVTPSFNQAWFLEETIRSVLLTCQPLNLHDEGPRINQPVSIL